MPRPRMRPFFRVRAACSVERLRSTVERHLVLDSEDVEGDLSAHHVMLRIPAASRRFWTPCLELTLAECEEDASETQTPRSELWGTFSPRAEIWTGFVFSIGTLAIVSLFSTIFGIAQLVLGHAPFGLLVPLVAAVFAVMLYVAALVGQGLSISEMYRLRAFVDDCLREAEQGTVAEQTGAAKESV
jgi:hypothetical protein